MKHKPSQVDFKLRMVVRKLAMALMIGMVCITMVGTEPAHATSTNVDLGSGRPIKPGPDYPSCTYFCFQGPGVPCCRTTPEIIIEQFNALNNTRYMGKLWPLMKAKIADVSNRIVSSVEAQNVSRGGFMTAHINNRSIGALQKGSAAAARDHSSSEALCRFATLSQGLGSSDVGAEALKTMLIKRSLDRQLMTSGAASATDTAGKDGKEIVTMGQSADKKARWDKYVGTFCSSQDFLQGEGTTGYCKAKKDDQYNLDINFSRAMGDNLTLDIGFGTSATKDMENVTALGENLYAHDVLNNLPNLAMPDGDDGDNQEIRKYMLLRSVIAKRAIAENSFVSLAAMKAAGSPASAEYTQNLMMELGISKEQAKKFVGENPSYYAQMEALTRKLYESPAFYTNLMEAPINVKRQQVSMKSLELMQQRDIYKSMQRSEMLMATLLEIYLSRTQGGLDKQQVQNQ